MKQRISSLPALVVVAVVALVLGSIGTAVAAPMITKSKVKSIATKIVNKKAPTLSVAHAVTADTATNATNLNGQPALTYQNPSYRFRLTGAAATAHSWTFAIPAGFYLFTFDYNYGGATSTLCYMKTSTAATVGGESPQYSSTSGAFSSNVGTGVIQSSGAPLNLVCQGGAATAPYTGTDVLPSATFTKVDNAITATAGGARPSDGGGAQTR